jgi:hypothetical protein
MTVSMVLGLVLDHIPDPGYAGPTKEDRVYEMTEKGYGTGRSSGARGSSSGGYV